MATNSQKPSTSFAYPTIKDRLPVILTKVIDGLSRDKEAIAAEYGEEGREDVKRVISCLSQLKNEMVTDKYFTQLVCGDDASKWNVYWRNKTENGTMVSWYSTEWLYAETYFYRRIKEAFLLSKKLADYDPFHKQKSDCLEEALKSMDMLAKYLLKEIETHDIRWDTMNSAFQRMLKQSLWANKVDLSLSVGNHIDIGSDPLKVVDDLDDCVLVDQSKEVWVEISKSSIVKDLIIARNVPAADIHRQINEVYGPNAMSDSKVRNWVRAFKDRRENFHDEPRSGRPSVITEDLVKAIDEKIREYRRFTVSSLAIE
ncbi:hypothetical protein J6590_062435 [Homalodisca vitripennis]|nr:hypothetical protein J6590_062435 [Homalodisca vitripennis]